MQNTVAVTLADILNCKVPNEANERFTDLLSQISKDIQDEFVRNTETIVSEISKDIQDEFLRNIETIVSEIFQDHVGPISARKFGEIMIHSVNAVPYDKLAVDALQIILLRMKSRNMTFELQLVELRDVLSLRLAKLGRIQEAADVLADIPSEIGQRAYSPNYKMDIYLRIAEFYVKLEDIPRAEGHVNRASLIQPDCTDDKLLLRYKITYANLLVLKEKFLEAGQRYAELSVRFPWVGDNERLKFLEKAVAAVLLANSGQQRSRLLATLYKDERCQTFEVYSVLEKMYLGRLISRSSLRQLEPLLAKHYPHLLASQKGSGETATATSGGGRCLRLLELARVQHNVLAASHIYTNTTLTNLAGLLEISPEEAESVSSQMISDGRLTGRIDQIDGYIHFTDQSSIATGSSSNSKISGLCKAVSRIVEDIENQHPAWVHEQLNSLHNSAPTLDALI